MREQLEQLLDGQDLDERGARALLDGLTDLDGHDAVKGAVLAALRTKGETAEEVRAFANRMRERARPFESNVGGLVDTCGTGGDGSGSVNLSTAAALVVASLGHPVAKHGNRSVSSKSGSADVLEAMGIRLPEGPVDAARSLESTGFTFLFAPHFHPAMAGVMPVRRALKTRTVFNLLGPLTNPARPAFQVIGTFSEASAALVADTLAGMALERAFVVHGALGWDEATPIGPFQLWDVRPGEGVRHKEVDPAQAYGVPRCSPGDLAGGDAEHNAGLLGEAFAGRKGPIRDAIALSAGLVLELLGKASGRDAVSMAEAALDNGAVEALLHKLGAQ